MQNTAQGFLIYTLTSSTAYLGYVGFVSGIPAWLFMLYGGFIADRVPRRTLILITQTTMMILAFILAALVFLKAVQPWHILVLSFLLGTANAFETPSRQSFVVELVDREDMTNAIALNGTMFNLGAIVGPSIAGIVYALTGPAWCFTINGLSFIAVISALLMMRIDPQPVVNKATSALSAIKEAFSYVRAEQLVLTLCISVLIYNVFANGVLTLLPAWAVKVLHGDVATNGWLLSARGLGAVIGGLVIATVASRGYRGRIWMTSSLLMPVIIAAFSFARWLPLSLLLLVAMGFSLLTIMNNSNAMVQSRTPDALRGRVMALYSLMFMGGGPIGALLIGLLADRTSEPVAALVSASVVAVFAGWIYIFRPQVRAMK